MKNKKSEESNEHPETPGLLTIITPVIIGLIFGAEPLGGYMAGVCVSRVCTCGSVVVWSGVACR